RDPDRWAESRPESSGRFDISTGCQAVSIPRYGTEYRRRPARGPESRGRQSQHGRLGSGFDRGADGEGGGLTSGAGLHPAGYNPAPLFWSSGSLAKQRPLYRELL